MLLPSVVPRPSDEFLLAVQHRLKAQTAKPISTERTRHDIDRIIRWIVDGKIIHFILTVDSGFIWRCFSHSAHSAKDNAALSIPSGLDLNSQCTLACVNH